MRVVKLSEEKEFSRTREVIEYFEVIIRERTLKGKFRILQTNPDARPKIGAEEFEKGKEELVIFSYKGEILYTAKTKSGIMENRDRCRKDYPLYFLIDIKTIKRVFDITLKDLEKRLLRDTGKKYNLARSQAWPKLENSKKTISAVEGLLK